LKERRKQPFIAEPVMAQVYATGAGKKPVFEVHLSLTFTENALPSYVRPDYLELDAKSCQNKAACTYFPLTAITVAFSLPEVPVSSRQGGCQRVRHSSASATDTHGSC